MIEIITESNLVDFDTVATQTGAHVFTYTFNNRNITKEVDFNMGDAIIAEFPINQYYSYLVKLYNPDSTLIDTYNIISTNLAIDTMGSSPFLPQSNRTAQILRQLGIDGRTLTDEQISAIENVEDIEQAAASANDNANTRALINATNITGSTWRSALSLGDSAVKNIGETSNDVAAGDNIWRGTLAQLNALGANSLPNNKQVEITDIGFKGTLQALGTQTADGGIVKDFTHYQGVRDVYQTDFVYVDWFYLSTHTSDSESAQLAVDYAIANNIKKVKLRGKTYTFHEAVVCLKWDGSDYVFFSLDIEGANSCKTPSSNNDTVINCTHSDTFAFGLHKAKGCKIRNLSITGTFTVNKTIKQVFEDNITTWTSGTCRDDRYSPYVGICIDPFRHDTPTGGGYPNLTSNYRGSTSAGGSGSVDIENCSISGFVGNVAYAPNGHTANCENMKIQDTRLGNSKIAVITGQDQSRSNKLENVLCWGLTHTILDGVSYGAQTGSVPEIDTLQIAGGVNRIWACETTRTNVKAQNLYAESLWSLGAIQGSLGVSIVNSIVKFRYNTEDNIKTPPQIIYCTDVLNAEGSSFLCYGENDTVLNFGSTKANFKGCSFNSLPYFAEPELVSYIGCNCITGGKVTDLGNKWVKTSFTNRIINGSIVIEDETYNNPTTRKKRWIAAQGDARRVSLGSVTLTTDGNGGASFTANDAGVIREGDAIISTTAIYNIGVDGDNTSTAIAIAQPLLGIVTDVTGTTITLKQVPFGVADGAYTAYGYYPTRYFGAIIGTLTSGSNVITNVKTEIAMPPVGARLRSDSFSGIPQGTYVTATGANTITLSKNAAKTIASDFFYDARFNTEYEFDRSPTAVSGKYYKKGDRVRIFEDGFASDSFEFVATANGIQGDGTHAATYKVLCELDKATAITDLNLTISDPPTQAEVQAISDKMDALLAAMRTANQLVT